MSPLTQNLSEGISLILRNWNVLRLAVEQGFGGFESAEKAAWLEEVVLEEVINNGNDLYQDELEDFIEEILSNEFSMSFDDRCANTVASMIEKLNTTLRMNDLSFLKELQETSKFTKPFTDITCTVGSDSSEEEDNSSELNSLKNPKNNPPEPDADGFVSVSKGRGRKH